MQILGFCELSKLFHTLPRLCSEERRKGNANEILWS